MRLLGQNTLLFIRQMGVVIERRERSVLGWILKRLGTEIEQTLLIGHETGCGEKSIPVQKARCRRVSTTCNVHFKR